MHGGKTDEIENYPYMVCFQLLSYICQMWMNAINNCYTWISGSSKSFLWHWRRRFLRCGNSFGKVDINGCSLFAWVRYHRIWSEILIFNTWMQSSEDEGFLRTEIRVGTDETLTGGILYKTVRTAVHENYSWDTRWNDDISLIEVEFSNVHVPFSFWQSMIDWNIFYSLRNQSYSITTSNRSP